jgi:hypothetical protein
MDYRQSPIDNMTFKPQSPIPDTPPDTPSPKSPMQSQEHLPTPHIHSLGSSQYTPATTPDSAQASDWSKPPYIGIEAKASGSPMLHYADPAGSRERISPTRPGGMREQQSQGPPPPNQPNHFTPAFYAPGASEKEEGYTQYQSSMNGGGAQPRRLYANTTPTSYTNPGNYPLSRSVSDTARAEVPAPGGFYDSPAYWLILYFFFNLGLTLFNKIVLVSFPFPYVSFSFHVHANRVEADG